MEEIDIRILDDNNKLIFDYEACVVPQKGDFVETKYKTYQVFAVTWAKDYRKVIAIINAKPI